MKRLARRFAILLMLAAAVAGFYYGGARYLWPRPAANAVETVGIIEAPEVNVTSRLPGRIVELALLEGDRVSRGQVLFRIEDIDLRNQLARAKAQLQDARADLHDAELTIARDRQLFAQDVISAKERDDSQTRLDRSRANVAAAKAEVELYTGQMSDTVVRSPIDGVIVSKALEVGEWVTPGTPVLTIDDLSTIWARVDLPETDLGAIRVGDPAVVALTTQPRQTYSGRVMAIGQEGEFATERDVRRGRQDIRTFYVKVRVLQADGEVKPGMTAEVSFDRHDGTSRSFDQGARAD